MSTCEATFFLACRSSTTPYVFFITIGGQTFRKPFTLSPKRCNALIWNEIMWLEVCRERSW